MKIAIIDYGSGNLRSAQKAFERAARDGGLQAEVSLTDDPEYVAKADRIVLPGVGAYADCRDGLNAVDGIHLSVLFGGARLFGRDVGCEFDDFERFARIVEDRVVGGVDPDLFSVLAEPLVFARRKLTHGKL